MRKPLRISRKGWKMFCNWYKSELRMNPKIIDRIDRGVFDAFRGGWNKGYFDGARDKYRARE